MDVKNCKKCRNLFNYISGPQICPACQEKMEEEFQKVKAYLQDHPNTSMAVTAQECEVEIGQIKQWLREERLTFATADGSELTCEKCGKPIMSGRFCDACKASVVNDLNASIAKPKPAAPEPKKPVSGGSKMRFLN